MASLSKSKHLFGFTSPRTLEKIIPEIRLLNDNLNHQKWDNNTQAKFFDILFNSDFYDGNKYPNNPALAARDRITRAPKALGLIQLSPVIKLTKAGEQLISNRRLPELFTKQLLKFQLPSPYHTQSSNLEFKVKPYLELLRLINELGSLSKTEIALFFLQMVNYELFEKIKSKIEIFRKERKDCKGNKKEFIYNYFRKEITEIFKDEIELEKFSTRESENNSIEKFLKTKENNMRDYADAFFRYIRATELVTVDKKTFHLKISEHQKENVYFILNNTSREPIDLALKDYQTYLFDPDSLKVLYDDKKILLEKIYSFEIKDGYNNLSIDELKDKLEELQIKRKEKNNQDSLGYLKLRKDMPEIYDTFNRIVKREVPDPPLFLEWNTWRAFAALNHAENIIGNFIIDLDGMPLSTAPGNRADIEIEYKDFSCIVEVTMSSGETQFNMEGSSVPRHFGDLVHKIGNSNSAYCFFIAPKISDTTKAHFFNLNRLVTKIYGGKTKIIPLNLIDFIIFIRQGIDNDFSDPKKLKNWLDNLLEYNQLAEDEEIWFDSIKSSLTNWYNETESFCYQ